MVDAAGEATRDLARTKEEILRVASEHFTRVGYYGARVDEIAAETSTTKRMIYYCFGSKDELFRACLKDAYAAIRRFEASLHLADAPPRAAVERYVRETLEYHHSHPHLAQLVRAENLLDAAHLTGDGADVLGHPVIEILDDVLARGHEEGVFTAEVTGVDLHLVVTALANFRVTNAPTVRALFGVSMADDARLARDIDQYVAMILGWLVSSAPPGPADDGGA